MIISKLNYKDLATYGILCINNGYTIDTENSTLNANVSIAFNLTDIENQIQNLENNISEMETDYESEPEISEVYKNGYEELLEILYLIREKLS
tara:strand:+ start:448 stop:726 length:279 start_codon:yes stop_codon:yes gene_type:complete